MLLLILIPYVHAELREEFRQIEVLLVVLVEGRKQEIYLLEFGLFSGFDPFGNFHGQTKLFFKLLGDFVFWESIVSSQVPFLLLSWFKCQ